MSRWTTKSDPEMYSRFRGRFRDQELDGRGLLPPEALYSSLPDGSPITYVNLSCTQEDLDVISLLDCRYAHYLELYREAETQNLRSTMSELRLCLNDIRKASSHAFTMHHRRKHEKSELGAFQQMAATNLAGSKPGDEEGYERADYPIPARREDTNRSHDCNYDDIANESDIWPLKETLDSPNTSDRNYCVDLSSPLAEENFATTAKLSKLRAWLRTKSEMGNGQDPTAAVHRPYVRLTQSLPVDGTRAALLRRITLFKGERASVQDRFVSAMAAMDIVDNPFEVKSNQCQLPIVDSNE